MSLMPNITYQIDNSIKIDSNFIVAIISLVVSIISLILATYIFYYQSSPVSTPYLDTLAIYLIFAPSFKELVNILYSILSYRKRV